MDEHRVNGRRRRRRELKRGGKRRGCRPSAYHREQTSKSLNGKTNYKRRGVPRTVARHSVQPADWRDAVSCPLLPLHAVLDDNMLALEFPGLKIEKLTVAGST